MSENDRKSCAESVNGPPPTHGFISISPNFKVTFSGGQKPEICTASAGCERRLMLVSLGGV